MCLPPNCTAILQPLDQNAIKLTKLYYKKNLLTHLVGVRGSDLEEKLKKCNIRTAVAFLANAWDKVSENAIKSCWNVLMSNNDNWTSEDDLPLSTIRNQLLEEQAAQIPSISNLLSDISPDINFSSEEIDEWIYEDIQDLFEETEDINISDDEIAADVESVVTQQIKTDDVIKALDISIEWASMNDISCEKILAIQEIKEAVVMKKLQTAKVQTKISNFFLKT